MSSKLYPSTVPPPVVKQYVKTPVYPASLWNMVDGSRKGRLPLGRKPFDFFSSGLGLGILGCRCTPVAYVYFDSDSSGLTTLFSSVAVRGRSL